MNICPHCSTILPAGESRCPRCGAEYWEPGRRQHPAPLGEGDRDEGEESRDEPAGARDKPAGARDEEEGCASILMLPLILSVCVTLFLILAGFLFNTLARFESQQFKLLWLAGSCGAGYLVFRLIHRLRLKKSGNRFPYEGGTPS